MELDPGVAVVVDFVPLLVMPLQSGVSLPMPLPVPEGPRVAGLAVLGSNGVLPPLFVPLGDSVLPVPASVPVPMPPDALAPIAPPPELPAPAVPPPPLDDCATAAVARPMDRIDVAMSFKSMGNLLDALLVIGHNLSISSKFPSVADM